jgi:hypothetical protein
MSRLSLELYQGVATLPVEPFCLLRRALICELLYSQTRRIDLLPYDRQQMLSHRVQFAPRGARSHHNNAPG